MQQGDYMEGKIYLEQALSICRELDSQQLEGIVLNELGLTYRYLGNYAQAMAYFEQALLIQHNLNNRYSIAVNLSNLHVIFYHQGNKEAALEYAKEFLQVAEDISSYYLQGWAFTFLGNSLVALGRLDEAVTAYQRAYTLHHEAGLPHLAMEPLAGLAWIAALQGSLLQAKTRIEEILSFLEFNTLNGTDDPFRIYLICYRILRDNQDPRAKEILNTAHNLLKEQAAKISDEALRHSFLENVQAHREIISELEKLVNVEASPL